MDQAEELRVERVGVLRLDAKEDAQSVATLPSGTALELPDDDGEGELPVAGTEGAELRGAADEAPARREWANANVCSHRHHQMYLYPRECRYTGTVIAHDLWVSGGLGAKM